MDVPVYCLVSRDIRNSFRDVMKRLEISPNCSDMPRYCSWVTPNTLQMSVLGSGVSNFFRDVIVHMFLLTMKTSNST